MESLRQMNAKDGYAIKLAIKNNYTIAIITGGREENIKIRFENLGVCEVNLGVHNKLPVLKNFMSKIILKRRSIVYG